MYIDESCHLIQKYKSNVYKSNIENISAPESIRIKYLGELYSKYENIGLNSLSKCGFVLVAGGLGERLNSKDVKVSLPIDQISGLSYLHLYIKYIISYQQLSGTEIYLCIMTSESTDLMIKHYLNENSYFGLSDSQIFIIKQKNVPTFDYVKQILCYKNGKIMDKPHGHGDIHYLLMKV